MSFNPCFLIPIYNHKREIARTVMRLAGYGHAIFIIDDGGDSETQRVLVALAAGQPLVRLLRLERNRGKGAAVMHGMGIAYGEGYSHALQIDADGQHDSADAARFFERGAAHPEAVICGRPVYDATAPAGRRYGRYITHFWVWVETLSFAIADSMCGFRLYPLAETCALIERAALPERMDFDTAIAVRLAWRGLPFENVPTRVTYPANGLSHFDMLRDNLRITRTHTTLVCGMLLRLPMLLARRMRGARPAGAHWSRLSERGSALGLRIIFNCYRTLGEKCARALLYPVVVYFFLTGSKQRTASLVYLRRVHARAGTQITQPGWGHSFQHMMAFAESAMDKMSAWTGNFDNRRIEFPNQREFDSLLKSGRGAVLIGSHLGNLELSRALASTANRATVNAVVYTDHAPRFNQMFVSANAAYATNLIQVSHLGPETAIMLKEKIERGELLVIVGDRTPPAENGRVCQADFLGQPALFAQGPFILASLLECPVYLFFCLREGDIYRMYFELFAEHIELPRREREAKLQAYLQRYAQRLETHCLAAPYQWFNFHDFWRL